jgi:hypothetical protein
MQNSIVPSKRQRCGNKQCFRSIDDSRIVDRQENKSIPATCFRLPFCNFQTADSNNNRDALVCFTPYCSNCGFNRVAAVDDDDDDDDDSIFHHFLNRKLPTKWNIPSLIRFNNDDSLPAIASNSVKSFNDKDIMKRQIGDNARYTESRYESFDTLLKSDRTTTTEASNSEFSHATITTTNGETLGSCCKCCLAALSSKWKYCPSCGIYLNN